MAYGVTLLMKAIKRPPPQVVPTDLSLHWHARGNPIRVHKVDKRFDRARYRAMIRTEREEAAAERAAARRAADLGAT